MGKTISFMIGKGSLNHNSRKFYADNIDKERSFWNVCLADIPLNKVYHELFDDALERYNAKQKRKDRRIDDYYEHIQQGKQEKLFHEVIVQIGNKDDTGADTLAGDLAGSVLIGYYEAFQERNPNMRVFSAHVHMDEATPHLHIDFVPFTTGSKRGLDTRVSLKKALEDQGFSGGTKKETEWTQWAASEKKYLAELMQSIGMEWEQKGTHNEHLSVLDFKKQQRAAEVEQLDGQIVDKKCDLSLLAEKEKVALGAAEAAKEEFLTQQRQLEEQQRDIEYWTRSARSPDFEKEWNLKEPKPYVSASSFYHDVALPLFVKLRKVARDCFREVHSLALKLKLAQKDVARLERANDKLTVSNRQYKLENQRLIRELGYERSEKVLKGVEAETGIRRRSRGYVR